MNVHEAKGLYSPQWLWFSSFSCGGRGMLSGWWKGFLRNLWVRQRCEQSWWSGSSCCLATPLATWWACCPFRTDIRPEVSISTHWKYTQSVKKIEWDKMDRFCSRHPRIYDTWKFIINSQLSQNDEHVLVSWRKKSRPDIHYDYDSTNNILQMMKGTIGIYWLIPLQTKATKSVSGTNDF